jgi:hypothetical protein
MFVDVGRHDAMENPFAGLTGDALMKQMRHPGTRRKQ